ncbi:MAG: aminotransferase class I/II-fold pyridoxal phosphate-dependent enzyme [Oscillospiraceae bacterium]
MSVKQHIFLASPHMSDEGYEKEFVKEAFDTNWIAPLGKNVNEFEKEVASKVGVKEAAALVSGTSAIHMALKSFGVSEGNIVFCQSLTFSATANPIIYQGAKPVFIDSEQDSWNMSPVALEKAFKKYPNVKAVIVVHLYGIAANLEEILVICKKHNVPLIEDAAEAFGTLYAGKPVGSFGDSAILSFNGNKIITSSGGGMLLFNTEDAQERAKKVRFWVTQSRDPARHYQHSEIGYNYRMSNIVAGIGRGQLKVLDKRVEKKRYIFDYYKNAFADIKEIEMMPQPKSQRGNCWLSCILLNGRITPTMIMDALEADDIESRPIWKPMHMQPFFRDCDYIDNNTTAQNIFEKGVCLPSDTKMTDEDLDRVIKTVLSFWNV